LTQFIAQADGLIASGTGPLHLAAAIGQRTLGLFPPTRPMHPGRWAALGQARQQPVYRPAALRRLRKLRIMTCDCMRAIKAEDVLQVVNR
jgi:ADP-heptose:LPS heptosyltransferase